MGTEANGPPAPIDHPADIIFFSYRYPAPIAAPPLFRFFAKMERMQFLYSRSHFLETERQPDKIQGQT